MSLTYQNICFRYIPLAGGASYLAFSSHIMNPQLFPRLVGSNELIAANALWFNAHIGSGLYLYGQRHIQQGSTIKRILYSAFGAVIFNFGSVLLWATTRQLLPKCTTLKCLIGLGSGAVLLYVGTSYISDVEKQLESISNEE